MPSPPDQLVLSKPLKSAFQFDRTCTPGEEGKWGWDNKAEGIDSVEPSFLELGIKPISVHSSEKSSTLC